MTEKGNLSERILKKEVRIAQCRQYVLGLASILRHLEPGDWAGSLTENAIHPETSKESIDFAVDDSSEVRGPIKAL